MDYEDPFTNQFFKAIIEFEPTNEIFAHPALVKILEYKWDRYARRTFFLEALSYLMFLVVYLINANYFVVERLRDNSDEDSDVVFWSLIMNAFIVCFVI